MTDPETRRSFPNRPVAVVTERPGIDNPGTPPVGVLCANGEFRMHPVHSRDAAISFMRSSGPADICQQSSATTTINHFPLLARVTGLYALNGDTSLHAACRNGRSFTRNLHLQSDPVAELEAMPQEQRLRELGLMAARVTNYACSAEAPSTPVSLPRVPSPDHQR